MRIIQCSCLGNLGKFGNQMFQYCFAKTYAEITNSKLEIPEDWIGRKIFNIKDGIIKKPLPTVEENRSPLYIHDNHGKLITNIDLYGFFQKIECYQLMSISKCREWLQIQDKWKHRFYKQYCYIACHLRRGDFVTLHHSYPVIQEVAYINSIHKYGYKSNGILWFSEETAYADEECNELGIDFLPDFMHLINADILFRGPSSFGFWAGVIGNNKMYSPEVDFPDYGGGRVGFISDVEFKLGLGPNKEGIFKP